MALHFSIGLTSFPARQQRRTASINLSRAPVGTPRTSSEAHPKIQLLQRPQTAASTSSSAQDSSPKRRDSVLDKLSSSPQEHEMTNRDYKDSGDYLNVFGDDELPFSRPGNGRGEHRS